jgi:putative ubiquitin-RnfH superfamily antitoxin RatB of RatAB toxin-antitoxin module
MPIDIKAAHALSSMLDFSVTCATQAGIAIDEGTTVEDAAVDAELDVNLGEEVDVAGTEVGVAF